MNRDRCQLCDARKHAPQHGGSDFDHEFVSGRVKGLGARKPETDWPKVKAAHLAEHPDCELAFLPGDCDREKPDVHHIMPRSMGGTKGPHGRLVTACRTHHDWIEGNRAEAKVLGLLERRGP